MKDCVYYPDIELDLDYLRLLVEKKAEPIPGMAKHHRWVKDDPYLESIRSRIPILSPVYSIYYFIPERILPPHIDADRMAALNIPLLHTEGTSTIFYDRIDPNSAPLEEEYDPELIVNNVIKIEDIKEIFRFTLLQPAIINTKKIHSVCHDTQTKRRTSISWGFSMGVTYDQVVEFFESMRVL